MGLTRLSGGAATRERPGLPHGACGVQAPPPGPGCLGARAPGLAGAAGIPDGSSLSWIVTARGRAVTIHDPRLPGLAPGGAQVGTAEVVSAATLVTGITRPAWPRWSGGGRRWHAPVYGGHVRRGASHGSPGPQRRKREKLRSWAAGNPEAGGVPSGATRRRERSTLVSAGPVRRGPEQIPDHDGRQRISRSGSRPWPGRRARSRSRTRP